MSEGSRDAADRADREQRFRRLFGDHYRDVLGYAMRRAQRADAEDATAIVFLTAWRRFDELPKGSEVLWLFGVARRVLANQQRGQRRRQRLMTRLRSERPELSVSHPKDLDGVSVVLDALHRLKPTDQEILRLATWEGLSHAEIGRVLGFSEGTVAVRLHRARRRMERQLRSAGLAPLGPVDPLGEGSGL